MSGLDFKDGKVIIETNTSMVSFINAVDGEFYMQVIDQYDEPMLYPISRQFFDAAKKEFTAVMLYKQAIDAIRNVRQGPYYHNIVSLVLQDLAKQTSNMWANKAIDELELTNFSKV